MGIFRKEKLFVCYVWTQSWYYLSLGFHIDLVSPNIEIHLPYCFIRIGWEWFEYSTPNKKYLDRFGIFPRKQKAK